MTWSGRLRRGRVAGVERGAAAGVRGRGLVVLMDPSFLSVGGLLGAGRLMRFGGAVAGVAVRG